MNMTNIKIIAINMTMGVETIETTIETTAIMTVEMITVTIRKKVE